jgi:hypothetical protein
LTYISQIKTDFGKLREVLEEEPVDYEIPPSVSKNMLPLHQNLSPKKVTKTGKTQISRI